MTPGAALLKFRRKFEHGLSTAWYRDVVRAKILSSTPLKGMEDSTCEIHMLTSEADWLNLVWALKSFYIYSDARYAACIHDDGTLSANARSHIRRLFPDARLIDKAEADTKVAGYLSGYPRCAEFRRTNHLAPKIFDFLFYMRSDRMLLLDSDVLFFRRPDDLLSRIEDCNYKLNTVNEDVADGYTVTPEVVEQITGLRLHRRFNSGLGLIHVESLRLDWIEEFLAIPGVLSHFWRIEQTLFALCSSRFGTELLPEEYRVHLKGGVGSDPCRHYVGAIRHLMYSEGLRKLVGQGFLTEAAPTTSTAYAALAGRGKNV